MYKVNDLVRINKALSSMSDKEIHAVQMLIMADIQKRLSRIENIISNCKFEKDKDSNLNIISEIFGGLV